MTTTRLKMDEAGRRTQKRLESQTDALETDLKVAFTTTGRSDESLFRIAFDAEAFERRGEGGRAAENSAHV